MIDVRRKKIAAVSFTIIILTSYFNYTLMNIVVVQRDMTEFATFHDLPFAINHHSREKGLRARGFNIIAYGSAVFIIYNNSLPGAWCCAVFFSSTSSHNSTRNNNKKLSPELMCVYMANVDVAARIDRDVYTYAMVFLFFIFGASCLFYIGKKARWR